MLICIVCNKTIANFDDGATIRYGGCASCPIVEVAAKMDDLKERTEKNAKHTQNTNV